MNHGSDEDGSLTEREIRDIVRDELDRSASPSKTRRHMLGMLGALGVAGLAGCGSNETVSRTPSESSPDSRREPSPAHSQPPDTTDGTSPSTRQDPAPTANPDQATPNGGGDVGSIKMVGPDGETTEVSKIDVGEGLQTSVEDGVLTISRQRDVEADGVYLASPGDLQSALDDAAADSVGEVRLVRGATYELDSSVEVPAGVSLDCTGARVHPQTDTNVFELHTQSRIYNPTVRTTDVDGYSSTIFHVYPNQFDESFGTNRPVPTWTVFGGWSEMTPGEGTCIELHGARANPSGDYVAKRHSRNVYFCFVTHNCHGGERFAYLHREGGETTRGGHVNGNIVKGFAVNTTQFVETDDTASGKNMVNGNKFYLTTQPGPESEWLWYANKGNLNELYEWGMNWDYASYEDSDDDSQAESWYIGPTAGKNYVWRKPGSASGGLGSTVHDDSNGESGSRYVVLDELGIPVDELNVWDGSN